MEQIIKELGQSQPSTPAANGFELLGEGSFGSIYYYSTHSIVYKMVIDAEGDSALFAEFSTYNAVSTATGHGSQPGSFSTPRAWKYWRPSSCELLAHDSSPPRTVPRSPNDRPSSLWSHFHRPTFVFDLIPSISSDLVRLYKHLFVAREAAHLCPSIRLLRLYLGREDLPVKTSAFHPGLASDLPLDVARYETLRKAGIDAAGTVMPTLDMVCSGMGQVLARLHWAVGINARDVELVLGSVQIGGAQEPQCYVLDFNQVSEHFHCPETEA